MEWVLDDLNLDSILHAPAVDGLIGLAVGDAFGVPVEFMSRKEVRKVILQEMEGNDTSRGFWSTWTDEIPRGALP